MRQWAHLYNNHQWRKARRAFLDQHPLCRHCLDNNTTTAATEVDHIEAHKGDLYLFWDSSNWQALCKPCHSRKTATQDGGLGIKPKATTPK